jgi:hypothetical protein
VRRIGIAFDHVLFSTDAFGRAVLPLGALGRYIIDLVQDGVINVAAFRPITWAQYMQLKVEWLLGLLSSSF